MKNLLQIENVNKSYSSYRALKDISLTVPEGSVFGLLGPNGAGKTSLIRIINQITMPDSGKVYLGGELLDPKHISQIGYLPEERGLYKGMKVGEQAIYLARLKGLTKGEAIKRLRYWFEKFGIENWWDKKIQELSKGMAQKVQFIVTVMHKPKLLIFDEPFSGFDPVNAQLIAKEILQLRDEGATVIFSTHRMESVEEMCDHIALIHKSEKILEGSIASIKKEYKTNTFEVGIQAENPEKAIEKISEKFSVSKATFKSLSANVKLLVRLEKEKQSDELLEILREQGVLAHYVEQIPSMNSIFLKAVNN